MYSPKINEKFIPELYQIGVKTGRTMTSLVNEAIQEYLRKWRRREKREIKK